MKDSIVATLVIMLLMTALAAASAAQTSNPDTTVQAAVVGNGQTNAETQDGVPSLTGSILPSLTRIAITLCIVVAIIYLAVFMLRKLSGGRISGPGTGKTIRVIEQTYLAPKKSVCLLKLGDRAVLVGITETNINLLTELEWETLPAEALERINRRPTGFPGALNQAVGKLLSGVKNKGVRGEKVV